MIPRNLAILGAAFWLFLGGAPATLATDGFDPAQVQSVSCRTGRYLCGFTPPTPDELAAVPYARMPQGRQDTLPARVDLSARMPPVGDQGASASGVAWALAYGLMSYNERLRTGTPSDAVADRKSSYNFCQADAPGADRLFSPAFVYNQLAGGQDQGIDLLQAARLLVNTGVPTCQAVPFTPGQHRPPGPDPAGGQEDAGPELTRARSLARLDPGRLQHIRASLAQGQPVVIGFTLFEDFYRLGSGVYERPTGAAQMTDQFLGGHAVLLVGYDDTRIAASGERGAFRFLNSFSTRWGDRGYGWMSYRAFRQLVRAAVVLEPLASVAHPAESSALPYEFDISETMAAAGVPAAPALLVASRGQYEDRIVVSFEPSPQALAYQIERAWPETLSENKSEPFEIIGYSREPVYVDRFVQPEVAYRYRVRALGASGNSPASADRVEGFATRGVKTDLPLRVTGVRATVARPGAGKLRVDLRWNAVDGARAYQVVRFDPAGHRWRVLARFGREANYKDLRPVSGAHNIYRVQAINDAGSGPWSETVDVLIGGPGLAPAPVTELAASRGLFPRRIELKWRAVVGADRYRVYRHASGRVGAGPSDEAGADRVAWEGPFEVAGATMYIDALDIEPEGLAGEPGPVAYRVAAGNAAGFSRPGPVVFGSVSGAEIGALPPPAELAANIERNAVRLRWSAVPEAVQYFILRKRAGESEFRFVGNVAGNAREYSEPLPWTGTPPAARDSGDLFFYTVRALGVEGGPESANSPVQVVFRQPDRQLRQRRFFWPSGSETRSEFEGTWMALDWDGESGPRRIEMRITRSGPRFEASFRIGNNPSRSFGGDYVFGSRMLEAPGFRMRLVAGEQSGSGATVPAGIGAGHSPGQESIVEITTRKLSPYDVELAFERVVVP